MTFAGTTTWNFDDIPVDQIPRNWKAERTAGENSPAVWKVIADTTAPSGEHVLSLTDYDSTTTRDYSMLWTDSVKLSDLEITFKCKNSGGENNNSGACWRVKDKDNYYCARASTSEGNFICYYVSNGMRTWITEEFLQVPRDAWRTIKIVQKDSQMVLSIDGVEKINLTDSHISGAGGVGVWTKGQSIISFDDFSVASEEIPGSRIINGGSRDRDAEGMSVRPAKGVQTLHFHSVQSQKALIELFTLNGVMAASVFNGMLAAGNHEIALANGKTRLPVGYYICSVKMGPTAAQMRFSIAR